MREEALAGTHKHQCQLACWHHVKGRGCDSEDEPAAYVAGIKNTSVSIFFKV